MSLKKQVIKSFLWNGLAGAMCEAMNLITSLLLARLLFPGDFGLMGMALFLIGFVSFFAEFGLIAALIQKKDLNDDTLSSLFWSTALTSALLYVLVYAGAPFYAAFYNEPRLTLIIRILFIDFLLYPISMIQYSMHIKKMNFKLVSIANIDTSSGHNGI
jgi:PST family polysaccharide transporter